MINVIYRYYPGENYKNRPDYYNKMLTLKSFLIAFSKIRNKQLIIAIDAPDISSEYLGLFKKYCNKIEFFGGLGNSKSYLASLKFLNTLNDNDLVYFSEDDYLYTENAFVELEKAGDSIPEADYYTLYDHPDRYTMLDDYNRTKNSIYIAGNTHWRTVESTCMTFGARVKALKADISIHKYAATKWINPHDRYIWRKTQGIGRYFWKFPKRKLIAPIPSLATHMEANLLAPHLEWESIAQKVNNAKI